MNTLLDGPALLFDHAHHARLRRRAGFPVACQDQHFLAAPVQAELLDRLSLMTQVFDRMAVIAPLRDDGFLRALEARATHIEWYSDIKAMTNPVDAIVDYGIMHTVDDVLAYLAQARSTLNPSGLFLMAFVGEMSLVPLRYALMQAETNLTGGVHNRTHPMIARADMAGLMQKAGYRLPVVDSDRMLLSYGGIRDLVRDLRGMGCTNTLQGRSRCPPPRALFQEAENIIRDISPDPDHAGRFLVPIDWVYAIGWAAP